MSNVKSIVKSSVHNPGATLEFRTDTVKLHNGYQVDYQIVIHPGAVVIVPINHEGQIIMVEQYRYCVDQVLLELPAGKLEPNNNSVIDNAQRELQEEIGYGAKNWQDLGVIYPAPGFSNEIQYVFLASDLYPSKLPQDLDEEISIRYIDSSEIKQLILDQKIKDSKSISALYLAVLSGLL